MVLMNIENPKYEASFDITSNENDWSIVLLRTFNPFLNIFLQRFQIILTVKAVAI